MKGFISRFVRNESGALSFEDGLTVISLTIGFIAALALVNGTIIQLYSSVSGLLTGSR